MSDCYKVRTYAFNELIDMLKINAKEGKPYYGDDQWVIYDYSLWLISKDNCNLIIKIFSSKTTALLNLNHDCPIIRKVAHDYLNLP